MTSTAMATLGAAALGLCLPLSIAGMNVALAVLTIAALLRGGRGARMTPLAAAAIAYAAWGLVSAAFSPDRAASAQDALKDWHRLWALTIMLASLPAADEDRVLKAAGAGAAAAALLGLWKPLAALIAGGAMQRAAATVHPVTFGWLMALACFAFLAGALAASTAAARRLSGAGALLCFAALAFSQTRSAQLAFAAGLVAAGAARPRWRKLALGGVLACAVAGGAVIALAPAAGRERGLAAGLGPRAELWKVAWSASRERPLTGLGPGGYKTYYAAHGPVVDNQAVWSNAHSLYLHQLAERGLPGLLIALAFLATAFAGAWARRAEPAGAVAVAATAAFAVFCAFETALQTEQAATAFLAVWAWAQSRPREMVNSLR